MKTALGIEATAIRYSDGDLSINASDVARLLPPEVLS